MSSYNTLAVENSSLPSQSGPAKQGSHKVQHVARGTAVSPGFGYPDLYIEIAFKSDSKTKLINPANVWTKDVRIMVAPYRQAMSEAFDAPTIGVHKHVIGSRLEYSLRYSVSIAGNTDFHVGVKDLSALIRKFRPGRGL